MKQIGFAALANGTLTWTAEKDYIFVGAYSVSGATSGSWVITTNPTITAGESVTPTSTYLNLDVWAAGLQSSQRSQPFPLKIPLPAGTKLYFSCSGSVCSIYMVLDDPPAEIAS